jgi:hypothetical protein
LQAATNGLLSLVPADELPPFANYLLWSRGGPPWPENPFPGSNVYDLGGGSRYLVDDRTASDDPSIGQSSSLGSSPDGGSPEGPSPITYSCGLWLEAVAIPTNVNANAILVTLRNTVAGELYSLLSASNITAPSWIVETNVTAVAGDRTPVLIPMSGRPALFFKVSEVVETNFNGLGYLETASEGPDSTIAVSSNYVTEFLNGAIAVYDKSGLRLAYTNELDFFRMTNGLPSGTGMLDGRILHDDRSNRWVCCAFDTGAGNSGQEYLAVSTTDDPTDLASGWSRYQINAHRTGVSDGATTLGLDDNGLYMTVNVTGTTNEGQTVVAIKKPEIYQRMLCTTRLDVYTSNSLPTWTIQPAVNYDPVPTNGYSWFVGKGYPDLGTPYRGGPIYYRPLQWSNSTASWVGSNWLVITNSVYRDYYDLDGTNLSFTLGNGIAGAIYAPEATAEGGSGINLHRTGSRVTAAVIRNGSLWISQHVGLSGTNGSYSGDLYGSNVDRSAVQWMQLSADSSNGSLSYVTHGRIYDQTSTSNIHYYYFPSLMVNSNNDVVLGFNGSTATNYVGAYYAVLLACGLPPVPRLIRDGAGIQPDPGWGDYSTNHS